MEGNPAGQLPGQQRIVNVHQAKTHLSRLIDAAHGGETILLAKAGKAWAHLMPLESEAPLRVAGRLRHLGPLSDPEALLQADGFRTLAITPAHGLRACAYSQPHRDPFDRMLAAQAELERLVLLTADTQLAAFPCQTLW